MLSLPVLLSALAVLPDLSPPDTAGGMHAAVIGAGIEERLGAKVDPSLAFLDASGRPVRLGEFLEGGKPVVLNFSYFHCPMLCGLVQDGMVKGLKELDWSPGADYRIVTVSMDWREGPAEASPVRERLLPQLGKAGADTGWHFLTGDYKAVRTLASSVGFHYNYVPGQNDFAHEAALIFISPRGTVSRYLYGIQFPPRDLRLALLDAAEGRSLSLGERLAMMCYQYDPDSRGYVLFARNSMKAGGLLVVGMMLLLLVPLWRREARNREPVPSSGKDA